MQGMFRSFLARLPLCSLLIALHKLFSAQFEQIDIYLVCEIFISEFIDQISLPNLPGTVYFQRAVVSTVFPLYKPVIDLSFKVHLFPTDLSQNFHVSLLYQSVRLIYIHNFSCVKKPFLSGKYQSPLYLSVFP